MHARTKVTVRYAETDRMGIVHHSNYPIWYEIARNDYIKMFGISYTDMENAGVMTPLLNLSCHFGIPALYDYPHLGADYHSRKNYFYIHGKAY